jgi:hypothetical protein
MRLYSKYENFNQNDYYQCCDNDDLFRGYFLAAWLSGEEVPYRATTAEVGPFLIISK